MIILSAMKKLALLISEQIDCSKITGENGALSRESTAPIVTPPYRRNSADSRDRIYRNDIQFGPCGTWVIKRDLLLESLSCPARSSPSCPSLPAATLTLSLSSLPFPSSPPTFPHCTFGEPPSNRRGERLCWFKTIIRGCKRFYMKKRSESTRPARL